MAQQKLKEKKPKSRSYSREVRDRLFAVSAGWCEFRDCRTFTLRHEPTLQEGNYGEIAHNYAFKELGPRPVPVGTVIDVNAIENLMLLCRPCHKRVDDNEDEYPVELLREFKSEHEQRIQHIAGLGPERRTKPLVFLANIVKDAVTVTDGDVFSSLFPEMFPSRLVNALDLSSLVDRKDWYQSAGQEAMQSHLDAFYKEPPSGGRPGHVSVYAIGPIPLLMQFGASITSKVKTEFYQRHRPNGSWKWGEGEGVASFSVTLVRKGASADKVALILSLSGKIHDDATGIPADYTVYEIEVKDGENAPNPQFLKTRADLERFRKAYLELVSRIVQDHPGVKKISCYPAVPAPVAVVCGFDLLPKAHPDLVVYDMDKAKGGFYETITISRANV